MAYLSGWGEGIVFTLAFLGVLGLIIADFNSLYPNEEQNLNLSSRVSLENFVNYNQNASNKAKNGDVALNAVNGITLKSSYDIMIGFVNLIWDFLSGGWIFQLVETMQLGTSGLILSTALWILYFISLIWGIFYVIFKVMP